MYRRRYTDGRKLLVFVNRYARFCTFKVETDNDNVISGLQRIGDDGKEPKDA